MVKDHSDRERERKPAAATWVTLSHRQDNTYHGLCYNSREHWLEREIAHWVHHEGSIRRPIALKLLSITIISFMYYTCINSYFSKKILDILGSEFSNRKPLRATYIKLKSIFYFTKILKIHLCRGFSIGSSKYGIPCF